jgi:hypothetical protein
MKRFADRAGIAGPVLYPCSSGSSGVAAGIVFDGGTAL